MRLWSINPKYLDRQGLVALWRESLLAQAVLMGKTKGYKNHSQLIRFKQQEDPIAAISTYLRWIYVESKNRGYVFDKSKIVSDKSARDMFVTKGQIEFEFNHLIKKLNARNNDLIRNIPLVRDSSDIHRSFVLVDGNIESWERNV